jgi:hypothetical protein
VESLDHNILQIENQRVRIERLEEACKDIVDEVRQSNHANKKNIPETFVTGLDQIEKELGGMNSPISTGLCDLQYLRFGFVPMEAPKKIKTITKERGKREDEEKIIEIAEQIIRGGHNKMGMFGVFWYALDIMEQII